MKTGDQIAGEAFKAVYGADPFEGVPSYIPPQTLDSMVCHVARDHKVSVDDILGARRSRHIVSARVECVRRMRNECDGASISNMANALCKTQDAICNYIRKAKVETC